MNFPFNNVDDIAQALGISEAEINRPTRERPPQDEYETITLRFDVVQQFKASSAILKTGLLRVRIKRDKND